jgi:phosphotriesterase-related protein
LSTGRSTTSSPRVNSVLGPADPAQLGLTLVHEHLRASSEVVHQGFPHLFDDPADLDQVVAKVVEVAQRGVRTICDPTLPGINRDVEFMRAVSERTGVRIIAGTGIYTDHELPPYFRSREVDVLADAYVHDIEVGIQGTDIKAGFVKCVTDLPGITDDVEKCIRATARAHGRTGVPVMTHSQPRNRSGLLQLDLLETEGVDPTRVLVGHCGDTDDLTYLEAIAERGAFLGMDRFGYEHYLPRAKRTSTIVELCRLGFADRILLSHDGNCCSDLNWDATGLVRHPMTTVLDEVIPELLEQGVSERQIRQMTELNVAVWFGATAVDRADGDSALPPVSL